MNRSLLAVLLCGSCAALAHQPIMDMAPRWSQGYGVQTRFEHFDSRSTVWLEGVYTWDRSIRATLKVPLHDGDLGDAIVGLPLKKYHNEGASTSNWSVTPSIQVPTGKRGAWDLGLSLSYSSETPGFYQLFDLYTWGDRTGLDINAGFSFQGDGQGLFALWDVSALTSDEGDRVQTGTVFVFFKRNMMLRFEYKAMVFERDSEWSGDYVGVGIGLVY